MIKLIRKISQKRISLKNKLIKAISIKTYSLLFYAFIVFLHFLKIAKHNIPITALIIIAPPGLISK